MAGVSNAKASDIFNPSICLTAPIAPPFFMALGRVINFCLIGRVRRIGTSEKVSQPPAMTVEACPERILSAAAHMAALEEMHA
jgi:hypothetical protein